MDTEKEMENIRIQAHDDMIKTKKIINAISPNLLKYITNNNTHKFTQNEGTKDYNQAILVIRQVEITLDQAQTQIDEIEKNNFWMKTEIKLKNSKFLERKKEKQNLNDLLAQRKYEKAEVFEEINRLQEKIKFYREKACDDVPLTILYALSDN